MFLSSNNKINLTLCGMMGSGKSLIGKKLAKEINFSFVDTDKLIEEDRGKSINKIFKEDGEEYFRKLEEKIILNILQKKKYVIALGGGSVENDSVRNFIKNNSYNIFLDVKIDKFSAKVFVDNYKQITADLIISADGKNSLIRKMIGIKENRVVYDQEAFVSQILHEKNSCISICSLTCH